MYTDAVDFGCMASSRAACARSCSFSAERRWRARRRQNGKWPSHHPLTQCCPTDRSSLLPLLVSFCSLFSSVAFISFQFLHVFSHVLLCFILLLLWCVFFWGVTTGRIKEIDCAQCLLSVLNNKKMVLSCFLIRTERLVLS